MFLIVWLSLFLVICAKSWHFEDVFEALCFAFSFGKAPERPSGHPYFGNGVVAVFLSKGDFNWRLRFQVCQVLFCRLARLAKRYFKEVLPVCFHSLFAVSEDNDFGHCQAIDAEADILAGSQDGCYFERFHVVYWF